MSLKIRKTILTFYIFVHEIKDDAIDFAAIFYYEIILGTRYEFTTMKYFMYLHKAQINRLNSLNIYLTYILL